jgi:hypothetical protein
MVLVDLPGPKSVALAARLVQAGMQPICTFDHWPHDRAGIPAERVLEQLMRHSVVVAEARKRLTPEAPPVWICDSLRLTGGRPAPGHFDNRYYLDDSLLPGPRMLRSAGIERLVLVVPSANATISADLGFWLGERLKDGFQTLRVSIDDAGLEARPFTPSGDRNAFRVGGRNDAGGFGVLVPVPSEGGGSGG